MSSGVYVLLLNTGKIYVGKSDNIEERIKNHKECNKNSSTFVKVNNGVKEILKPITPSDSNYSNWEKDETLVRMIKHGYNNVRGWEFTNTNNLTETECNFVKMSIMGLGDRCRKCGNSGHFAKECSNEKAKWLKDLEECLQSVNQNHTSSDIMNTLLDKPQIDNPKYKNDKIIHNVASTGKSKCQKCKSLISKGDNRIGIPSEFRGRQTTKWFHQSCYKDSNQSLNDSINKGKQSSGKTGDNKNNCYTSEENCCFRCDRKGHYAQDCYAKTYNDGSYISESDDGSYISESDDGSYISESDDGSYISESEDEIWCCNYCNKEFETEKGARYHEMKYCKKKYAII